MGSGGESSPSSSSWGLSLGRGLRPTLAPVRELTKAKASPQAKRLLEPVRSPRQERVDLWLLVRETEAHGQDGINCQAALFLLPTYGAKAPETVQAEARICP